MGPNSYSILNSPEPGAYVAAVKRGHAITKAGGTVTLFRYGRELDRAGYLAEMRGALDRRINLRGGLDAPRGRKDDADWLRWTASTARAVNTPRLIVRESTVPLEFRERLAGRLTTPADEEW